MRGPIVFSWHLLFELAVGRNPYSEKIDDWRTALPELIRQRASWTSDSVTGQVS